MTGIGRPRISGKDLRKIMIPLPDKKLQEKVMQNLRANEISIKQLKDRAEALFVVVVFLFFFLFFVVVFFLTGGY